MDLKKNNLLYEEINKNKNIEKGKYCCPFEQYIS